MRSSAVYQAGFTYLIGLLLVAALGAGLAFTGEIWSHARQRERETELLWVGNQFRQAIGLYYQRSPGAVKRYPEKLDDLLEDRRYLSTQRYLRKIYADPISGKAEWDLVPAPGGGIMGVRSLSAQPPIRVLDPALRSYGDWKFVYEPSMTSQNISPARVGGQQN